MCVSVFINLIKKEPSKMLQSIQRKMLSATCIKSDHEC